MPIRLSGMVSGMDTESLVTALVSGYQLKKDNLVKAQTKLSWKQEKWKTMNTSIYSFYSGKLSSARLSNAYSLKKSTVSNSSVATVTASSSAVNGTQRLRVEQLATSGYLTGGEVKNADESKTSKITGSSKLSDITGNSSQGSITVSVDGKSKNIDMTSDMTVNQFVAKLKDAGVQASFDETNQRFFISSKTSGEKGDFKLVANDSAGFESLKSLRLYTKDSTTTAEYKTWADYYDEYNKASDADKANTALGKIIVSAYDKQKTTFDTVAKEKLAEYNKASATVSSFKEKYADSGNDTEVYKGEPIERAKAMLQANKDSLAAIENTEQYKNDNGEFDESLLTDDVKKEYNNLKKSISSLESDIKNYTTAEETKDKLVNEGYVIVTTDDEGNEKATALSSDATGTAADAIQATVDDRNADLMTNLTTQYVTKAESSKKILASTDDESEGAKRIIGKDAIIYLNDAKFTNNTSTFSINGLTIQATSVTSDEVTITTDTDVEAIYKSIKGMFTEYNNLIKSMDEAYNAASSKGYEPLTDDEKEAMSDSEVEKWETKIKDSLLRKDDTLSSIINTMKNDMAASFTINGKSYSLSSFGISTLGYFASGENEKGVYHIDGDSEDTATAGNEDKLRAAIAQDPEAVVAFFSKLSSKLYTDLGNKMASSSVSSAYTVYNDKQMNTQYSEYNTKISDAENKVTTWEDYYYSKFSAMESALAKLNSQSSSMSGLFGS